MTLEIANQLREIEKVQIQLVDYLKELPLDDYDRKKIFIAVDEILSNIINYGYDDNERHTIQIRFDATETGMNMEFIDDGKYFDPIHFVRHHLPKVQLDDEKSGGLGLHLVHRLMNQMQYNRVDDKNRLILGLNYTNNNQ
ncbi:MAG: ATP-binding protein [Saprospiraceae bacterium]|nr:ATP-binding protein [Saprospiraceae bacterium]